MILRKPTKIELKPEDDLAEYEEFKRGQPRRREEELPGRGRSRFIQSLSEE
jgi:hypothetical protein